MILQFINIVADAFSRLCDISDREQFLTAIEEYILEKEDSINKNIRAKEELNALNDELKPIPEEVYKRIAAVHNSTVEHLGVERTMRRLLCQKYSIEYLREYVRAFIKHCPLCQKMAMIAPVIVTRPFTVTSSSPMVNINMDYLYMSTEDENGNKFVLVVIDTFTRFTELYPCKTVDGMTVALEFYIILEDMEYQQQYSQIEDLNSLMTSFKNLSKLLVLNI